MECQILYVAGKSLHVDGVGITRAAQARAGSHAVAEPAGVRDRDVKWLDPAAVRRWVDVGLRGLLLDGHEPYSSRNRTGSRDAAFADFLYGTGLRVSEGASLLDVELPDDGDPGRVYFTCRLAGECAKDAVRVCGGCRGRHSARF